MVRATDLDTQFTARTNFPASRTRKRAIRHFSSKQVLSCMVDDQTLGISVQQDLYSAQLQVQIGKERITICSSKYLGEAFCLSGNCASSTRDKCKRIGTIYPSLGDTKSTLFLIHKPVRKMPLCRACCDFL